ncbi:MAG: ATP-dependent helicase, partial [Candidatus Spechtbacterales bacterium]
YVTPLLRTFSEIKKEGVGPEKLREFVAEEEKQFQNVEDLHHGSGPHKGKMKGKYQEWERNILKNKEMVAVYRDYQEKLQGVGYDYDDIILSVVLRLESDEILLQRLQEQYKYLLADEHQDTNQSQNRVLELLCAHQSNPNIFVVGDEKQSIYRFQGANLANFLYFHSRYPAAKIIMLKENYRSTQSILDASGSIMHAALIAKSEYPEKKIRIYSFQNVAPENYFIARKIKRLVKNGADPKEIAVLYRDNRDAFPIRDILQKSGVPYRVESDEQLLENNDIKNLFLILRAVADFGSDGKLAQALYVDFLKIPSLDIYKLFERRPYSLHDALGSKNRMRALGVSCASRLNNFYSKLSLWNKRTYNKSAPQVFESIVRESGFFDHVLAKEDYIEGIDRVRTIHSFAKRLAAENKNYTLRDFVRHLELIEERGISLRERKLATKRSAARLMTAHRAKGLEFDYVFIVGANMGHWGKRHTRQLLKPPLAPQISIIDKEDDERRLFYVALTRARKGVYISYPRTREDGRELFPSQFIEEISNAHKVLGNSEIYEKGLERDPKIF